MRRHGYSLVEVMIAMFIGALLMTAAFQVMKMGNVGLLRLQGQADMQVARGLCVEPLTQDLRQSMLSGVTIINAPVALALRPEDPAASAGGTFVGLPQFNIYYFNATAGAFEKRTWSNDPKDPVTLTPDPIALNTRLQSADLANIVAHPNGSEHVLAKEISAVTITPSTFAGVFHLATVSVSITRTHVYSGTDTITSTFQFSVTPRGAP